MLGSRCLYVMIDEDCIFRYLCKRYVYHQNKQISRPRTRPSITFDQDILQILDSSPTIVIRMLQILSISLIHKQPLIDPSEEQGNLQYCTLIKRNFRMKTPNISCQSVLTVETLYYACNDYLLFALPPFIKQDMNEESMTQSFQLYRKQMLLQKFLKKEIKYFEKNVIEANYAAKKLCKKCYDRITISLDFYWRMFQFLCSMLERIPFQATLYWFNSKNLFETLVYLLRKECLIPSAAML